MYYISNPNFNSYSSFGPSWSSEVGEVVRSSAHRTSPFLLTRPSSLQKLFFFELLLQKHFDQWDISCGSSTWWPGPSRHAACLVAHHSMFMSGAARVSCHSASFTTFSIIRLNCISQWHSLRRTFPANHKVQIFVMF